MRDSFINFEDIKKKKLSIIKNSLKEYKKIKVSKLKIKDLIIDKNNKPIKTGNGVYIFYDDQEEVIYLGKSSSRSFIERIPAHFDLRGHAWMNTLLKKIYKPYNKREFKYPIYLDKKIKKALSLNVLFINFKNEGNLKKYCNKLEKGLRLFLKPRLNPYKSSYQIKRIKPFVKNDITLQNYLNNI